MRAPRLAGWIAVGLMVLPRAGLAQRAGEAALKDALAQRDFPPIQALDEQDTAYLRQLARETWGCIASLVEPKTGLPYDASDRSEFTSVSNLGLYLTSIIAARDLGFITSAGADERLDKAVTSIETLQTWHGFQQCWNSVTTLKPAPHDPAISFLDTGNFVGGLITVSQASPAHHERCEKLLKQMDWSWVYDADRGLLRGGFNTQKNEFQKDWYTGVLATDAQLGQLVAIATNAAPPEMWDKLLAEPQTRFGVTYLHPGWDGGGLFMQYISGLWLDQRGTLMGRSAENFAYSQILQAKEIGAPVWGWSAAFAPDGEYLGWGHLKDEVVTPHACVLAIDRFPKQVVANLHALEALHARPANKGFVDSVNWKAKTASDKYLLLDQGMLFLSLANYLQHDTIRHHVQSHPIVIEGRKKIRAYSEPLFGVEN